MIPERIALAGFLCYREPQEACFQGRTLWMFSGENGSGKSALFDAMTFVLFGQHRGGKQNARGLIHHDCDHFWIELDITLDEQRYRARRTLSRKGRATRQISAWEATAGPEQGRWRAVPDTHSPQGFAQWIDANVALTYESFTASVLLLQGKADNLLLATPAERHRLLCQVVGLDGLQQLADRAGQQRTRAEGAEKSCRVQLQRCPAPHPAHLADLEQLVAGQRQRHTRQSNRIQELTRALDTSRQRQQLTHQLTSLNADLARHQTRLETLTRRQARQRDRAELRAQMDSLRTWLASTTLLATLQAQIGSLEQERDVLTTRLQQAETSLHLIERCSTLARRTQADLTARERYLNEQYAGQIEAFRAARRFLEVRKQLDHLWASRKKRQEQLDSIRERARVLDQLPSLENDLRAAESATRDALQQTARCEAMAGESRRRLERFRSVAGSAQCPYCLQPLDPRQHAREEQRLATEANRFDEQLVQMRRHTSDAQQRERELRQAVDRQSRAQKETGQRTQQCAAELHAQDELIQEITRQCEDAWHDLPEPLRDRAGTTSAHPCARDELLDANVSSLEQAAINTRQLRRDVAARQRLLLDLLDYTVAEQQQLASERHAITRRITALTSQLDPLREKRAVQETLQATFAAALPPQWLELSSEALSTRLRNWSGEQGDMSTADGQLEQDMTSCQRTIDQLQARHHVLCEQEAELPDSAAHDITQLETLLNKAREQLERAEKEGQTNLEKLAQAGEQQRAHLTALERLKTAQHTRRLWARLQLLLGPEGLQRALLENAQQAIIQYANTILDRLAGGQLYIALRPRDTTAGPIRALDLIAHTTQSGAHPRDVAFLSGSQKFRVAVALALAIGQFASHASRPVQAVIVDEGFGCLDTANRSVMIQELQNLQGHLQRILLVSHQEEFVGAFPDGYRCELVEGATRLTRLHA